MKGEDKDTMEEHADLYTDLTIAAPSTSRLVNFSSSFVNFFVSNRHFEV
jgi:hypothetical protein